MKSLNEKSKIVKIVVMLIICFFITTNFTHAIETNDDIKENETEEHILTVKENKYILFEEYFEPEWTYDSDGDLAPEFWEMIQSSTEVNGGFQCWWNRLPGYGNDTSHGAAVWWGTDWQDEWLILPPLDFSMLSEVRLQFWTWNYGYLEGYMEYDVVKISPDWGETWDEITNLYVEAPSGSGYFGEVVEFDLSDYDGEPNILIAFNRGSTYPNTNLGQWIIDDVIVTAESVACEPAIDIYFEPQGRGLKALIKNIGTETVNNVEWSIDLSGGFIFFGRHHEGVIDQDIEPGEAVEIESGLIIALGVSKVMVSVHIPGDGNKDDDDDFILVKVVEVFSFGPIINYLLKSFPVWVQADGWDFYPTGHVWDPDHYELTIEYGDLSGDYFVRLKGFEDNNILFFGIVEFNNGKAVIHYDDYTSFFSIGKLTLSPETFWEVLLFPVDGRDREKITGIHHVGIEWVENYAGSVPNVDNMQESAEGFYNGISALSNWKGSFNRGNKLAWERHFKCHQMGGDNIADTVDFAYFGGHGIDGGIGVAFGTGYDPNQPNGGGDWRLISQPGEREVSYGFDLEFIVFDSCVVLMDEPTIQERWANWPVFFGLHYILGFSTRQWGYSGLGGNFAEHLTGERSGTPKHVAQAWEYATHESCSGDDVRAAWLRATGPGPSRDTEIDYLPGLGSGYKTAEDPVPILQVFRYHDWPVG